MAAQFMATKGNRARPEALWIDWAKSSLPVPLSPMIRVGLSMRAMRLALSTHWRMAGLSPLMSSKVYRATWPRLAIWWRREVSRLVSSVTSFTRRM